MRVVRSILAAVAMVATTPALAQKLPSAVGEEIALGNAVSGVPCRLRSVEPSDGGNERWRVMCEGWERPTVAIWRSNAQGRPENALRDDGPFRRVLENVYLCEPAQPRKLLGDVEAAVRSCKLRDGGWPAFILAARPGGKLVGIEGLPDAMPAVEAALALMAGRPARPPAGRACRTTTSSSCRRRSGPASRTSACRT